MKKILYLTGIFGLLSIRDLGSHAIPVYVSVDCGGYSPHRLHSYGMNVRLLASKWLYVMAMWQRTGIFNLFFINRNKHERNSDIKKRFF